MGAIVTANWERARGLSRRRGQGGVMILPDNRYHHHPTAVLPYEPVFNPPCLHRQPVPQPDG